MLKNAQIIRNSNVDRVKEKNGNCNNNDVCDCVCVLFRLIVLQPVSGNYCPLSSS